MPIRTLAGRKTTSVLVVLASAVLGVTLVAVPAHAEPDLEKVKAKVEKLQHEAEVASERYNDARETAVQLKDRLDALNADLLRQKAVVETMRLSVATSVVDQFQGNALSTPAQAVLSENPDAFLENLNALSTYNQQRGRLIADYQVHLERLELRKDAVKDEARKLGALEKRMLAAKKQIDEKADAAEDELGKLEAEAREKILAGEWEGPLPQVSASGRMGAVLDYAMAQVGDAYVWGAMGPNAFDCSGLTMMAFAQAGISLPHSSRMQSGMGVPVSRSELQPGDLIFGYSPVSHVGIYIGNGLMVHAANPGAGVRVDRYDYIPFSGARRVG